MRKRLLLVLIISLLSLATLANEGRWIEAKGIAVVINNQKDLAYEAAIKDALKRAVETGVGVYVSVETKTENFALISDSILTKANGYVKEYTVMNTSFTGDYCQVWLKAYVSLTDLKNDLVAQGLMIKRAGDPRIIVQIEDDLDEYYLSMSVTQEVAEKALKDKGYNVIKSRPFEQYLAYETKEDEYLKLVDADILVRGRATATRLSSIGGMFSYGSTVVLSVYRSGSSQILASVTKNGRGIHVSPQLATELAIKEALSLAIDDLSWEILTSLTEPVKRVQLKVLELDFSLYSQLPTNLQRISGVSQVYPRSFSNGQGLFDIDTTQSSMAIAIYLNQNLGLEIIRQTENIIETKVVKTNN